MKLYFLWQTQDGSALFLSKIGVDNKRQSCVCPYGLFRPYMAISSHMVVSSQRARRRTLSQEDRLLSKRIQELRLERHLTQEALSRRLGCNQGYMAFIESGRSGLSLLMVYRLAKIFGVKVRDLFTF